MKEKSRRDFLKSSAGVALAMGTSSLRGFSDTAIPPATPSPSPTAPPGSGMKKGLVLSMLPANLSYANRFELARDNGFEVIQAPTTPNQREADEIKSAADVSGVRVDSVMNMDHWKYPLSSPDPAVVDKCLQGIRTSMNNAKLWGSEAVLLVPAVVDAKTSYREAWTRSQKQIRTLLPLAEQLKVVIAIEEVWNKFLLSPLEMAAYLAEFKSPWIRAWFDVGNVMFYGFPQDWIRTLGKSIYKIHLKDFKRSESGFAWVNLGDGDVDWAEVRKAFAEIGFSGSVIAEMEQGGEADLRDISRRIDRLVLGKS